MSRAESGRLVPIWRTSAPMLVALALVLVLAFLVFRFFLLTFAVAGSVALLLAPLQGRLARRFGGRPGLAAGLLVLVCFLLLLMPVFTYGTLLTQRAGAFFEWLRPRLEPAAVQHVWSDLQAQHPGLMDWVRLLSGGTVFSAASEAASRVVSQANSLLQAALTGVASTLLDLCIVVMMLFFLLRDGPQLREALRGVSPLTAGQEADLVGHLTRTVKGVLLSMVIVPLAQGVVAFAGFWLFGVPSPLLWSAFVVLAALIPLLGSPLAWVPAGVYLLVTGETARGVGFLVYGAVVVSGVDNVVKPLVLKGAAQIHTLLGFLSILGGVFAFGPKGLIVGPVVLSLVLSAYRIYRYDVLRWRRAIDSSGEFVIPVPRTPTGP